MNFSVRSPTTGFRAISTEHLRLSRPTPTTSSAASGSASAPRAVFRTMMRFPDQLVAGAMWHPSFLADDDPDSPHLTAAELKGSLYVALAMPTRFSRSKCTSVSSTWSSR